MSVWAVMMVKDEADVIEPVLRHISAQGVHGIIVADNESTDGTVERMRSIESSLYCPLRIAPDFEVGYYQSRKMTVLANMAHSFGATWIWPCDADELWYFGTGKQQLAAVVQTFDADVVEARLWHHFCTQLDDTAEENPFRRLAYRHPVEAPIGKVLIRWNPGCVIEAGNHGVSWPGGYSKQATDIQIRHFPYRSAAQFVRKAINGSRAYAATDLPWGTGQHWREYGQLYERGGEAALYDAFSNHFWYDLPSADGLVYDPARLDS